MAGNDLHRPAVLFVLIFLIEGVSILMICLARRAGFFMIVLGDRFSSRTAAGTY